MQGDYVSPQSPYYCAQCAIHSQRNFLQDTHPSLCRPLTKQEGQYNAAYTRPVVFLRIDRKLESSLHDNTPAYKSAGI